MRRLSLAAMAMLVATTLLGCPSPPPPGGGASPTVGATTPANTPPSPVGPSGTDSPAPAPPEPPYETVEVKDGGTITGKVTVVNKDKIAPIKPAEVTVNQDACGPTIESDVLEIQGTGLKNALVYLEDIEKGAAGKPGTPTVTMEKCRFVPHVQWAVRGATLGLKNADPHAHGPHVYVHDNTNATIDKMTLEPGASRELALNRSGLMRINSDTHTWMQAWLYVSPHPYVALTDATGAFKIENVPPGRYTMIVWHEGWDGQDQIIPVEVKAKATATHNVEFDGELFAILPPSGAEKPNPSPQAPPPPSPGMTGSPTDPGGDPNVPSGEQGDQPGGEPDEGPDDGGAVEEDGPGASPGATSPAPPAGSPSP